jgi:hypothetical protein
MWIFSVYSLKLHPLDEKVFCRRRRLWLETFGSGKPKLLNELNTTNAGKSDF